MAKVFIEETTLTAIGEAIRGKTGKTELIDPANMSTEIAGIEAGGGPEIPESAFIVSGNISNQFYGGKWDWFLTMYGDRITTANIDSATYAFAFVGLEELPFQVNIYNANNISYIFAYSNLKTCPKIRGNFYWNTWPDFGDVVSSCKNLTSVEDLFTPEMLDGFSTFKVTSGYSCPKPIKFVSLSSLRSVPSWFYKFSLNEESSSYPTYSYCLGYSTFSSCYVLDEVKDFPVWRCAATQTGNMFSSMVSQCSRLASFTFETNPDGTPITTEWKSQTIDFGYMVGYTNVASYITGSNAGITMATMVNDDAAYQALKNDPDYWAGGPSYSRYNHDSAVETINSLPDTSAYLASAGGTNIIKFKRDSGSKTDGGACGNLTEEEIAVAAAKGWTVTLS